MGALFIYFDNCWYIHYLNKHNPITWYSFFFYEDWKISLQGQQSKQWAKGVFFVFFFLFSRHNVGVRGRFDVRKHSTQSSHRWVIVLQCSIKKHALVSSPICFLRKQWRCATVEKTLDWSVHPLLIITFIPLATILMWLATHACLLHNVLAHNFLQKVVLY